MLWRKIRQNTLILHVQLAGHETVGIHLAYLTYHLAQHPSIQERLRLELRINTTATTSLRSLEHLPLLEAVVLETHRLTPSISGPLPRVTPPQGCELAGSFIPGGVRVSGQAYSLHKEERVFGHDAHQWRPDRWLEAGDERGKEMRRWMWQFGGGGRGCWGQHFATLRELLRSLFVLAFHYRVKQEEEEDIVNVSTNPSPSPLEIKAVVVAIYTKYSTVMVDGDDGVIEQQDGFLTPPKSSELFVEFVRL